MTQQENTLEKPTALVEQDKQAAEIHHLMSKPVGGDIRPVVPQTFKEVFEMADAIIAADMVPMGLEGKSDKETRSKVGICIQKGLEVGFAPVTSLSRISVINGRPCIDCEGAMAKALESGKLEWCKERFEGEGDNRTAVCELKRRGVDEPMTRKFSVADAKRAKLWNNPKRQPWIQYPQRMLPIRARAWALRDLFSDMLAGLGIAEEVRDIPAAPCAPDTSFLDDETTAAAPDEPESEAGLPEPSVGPDDTAPHPATVGVTEPGNIHRTAEAIAENYQEPEPAEIHPYMQNMMDRLAGCQGKGDVGTLYVETEESRETFLADNPDQKDALLDLFADREKELP